ncbi:MAG: glycosyltransferase [Planctomycetes bacterium]|nr:glycosyltransferase [Planctomycetota bacterium]
MKIIKSNVLNEPDISIIIPAFNEENYLPLGLRSLIHQKTSLTCEIILIDDFSTDRTVEIAEMYNCTVFSNAKKLNVSEMRNFGFSKSHGKVVLYMDADIAFSRKYFENMCRPIIDGKYDVTLCFWQTVLENRYRILPDKHSRFYALLLRALPEICWRKAPIRGFRWFENWFKRMKQEGKLLSLLSIPDRVHTSMIAMRRDIPGKFGGWTAGFGAHADTSFSNNVYEHARKTRWILGVNMYYSLRRFMPKDENEFIRWLLRKIGIKIKNKGKNIRDKGGYIDPKGIR